MKAVLSAAIAALTAALVTAWVTRYDPTKCPAPKVHQVPDREMYLGQLQCSFQKMCLLYIDKNTIHCGDYDE